MSARDCSAVEGQQAENCGLQKTSPVLCDFPENITCEINLPLYESKSLLRVSCAGDEALLLVPD